MTDYLTEIMNAIDDKINEEKKERPRTIAATVIKNEGVTVDVSPFFDFDQIITKVPVLQSPSVKTPCSVGTRGYLVPCSFKFDQYVTGDDKTKTNVTYETGRNENYSFSPFCNYKDFEDTAKEHYESVVINSPHKVIIKNKEQSFGQLQAETVQWQIDSISVLANIKLFTATGFFSPTMDGLAAVAEFIELKIRGAELKAKWKELFA